MILLILVVLTLTAAHFIVRHYEKQGYDFWRTVMLTSIMLFGLILQLFNSLKVPLL